MKQMRIEKGIICLAAVMMLVMMPLCACRAETEDIEDLQPANVNMTLVSYDIVDRYKSTYEEYKKNVWLRFIVEYDEERFTIEDTEILYYGPNENRVLDVELLSSSDPYIFDYRFGYMRMKDPVDDSYIRDLISDGYMEARFVLREKDSGEELAVECDIDSENAVMETETDEEAYEITVNKYEYEEIDISDRNLDTKLRMYRDTHPGIKCYRVKLYGKEKRKPPYKVIGAVEFYSLSSYLSLNWDGGVGGVSSFEWLDAYDLLYETEKDIYFEGTLLADDTESIPDLIRNAEMVVTYSTEYAGTFDTFDAGDRFDGPRMCTPIKVKLAKPVSYTFCLDSWDDSPLYYPNMDETGREFFSDYTDSEHKLVWLLGWIYGSDYIPDLEDIEVSCSIDGVNVCIPPFLSDTNTINIDETMWFRIAIAISVDKNTEPEEAVYALLQPDAMILKGNVNKQVVELKPVTDPGINTPINRDAMVYNDKLKLWKYSSYPQSHIRIVSVEPLTEESETPDLWHCSYLWNGYSCWEITLECEPASDDSIFYCYAGMESPRSEEIYIFEDHDYFYPAFTNKEIGKNNQFMIHLVVRDGNASREDVVNMLSDSQVVFPLSYEPVFYNCIDSIEFGLWATKGEIDLCE
ncbi:hypothetical protein [Aristaeella lactis]|uniref:Uncharacterized protein n=1 Tax=Aristaeella lactis TaxID=3046383 RepID=A0AC61PNI8_9FIRM|nr:hypothetical protein [Aristaeella lactis]QUA52557.1 hypothetical protein JYE50_12745 [Aristaeella lactis]SMC77199.1 hypothetical protein SAMN06297397_2436 [Aristaeella lactis]